MCSVKDFLQTFMCVDRRPRTDDIPIICINIIVECVVFYDHLKWCIDQHKDRGEDTGGFQKIL